MIDLSLCKWIRLIYKTPDGYSHWGTAWKSIGSKLIKKIKIRHRFNKAGHVYQRVIIGIVLPPVTTSPSNLRWHVACYIVSHGQRQYFLKCNTTITDFYSNSTLPSGKGIQNSSEAVHVAIRQTLFWCCGPPLLPLSARPSFFVVCCCFVCFFVCFGFVGVSSITVRWQR